ncbi:MAG: tryptophan-rich sensory protein [Desulfobacterota bacterium]|nr:tryptophan-rich sensory protein [Thermodesulfobacteriota bacterium]
MGKLAASLLLCQLAGLIGSLFTTPAIPTWYEALKKPPFTPPNWVFTPVWIGLFVMMGISLFLVWQRKDHPRARAGLVFFFVQLGFNTLWSIAFFGLRSPLLGLIDILLLWPAILLTIYLFFQVSRWAGFLLLPYHLWVSFAAVLNYALYILNR